MINKQIALLNTTTPVPPPSPKGIQFNFSRYLYHSLNTLGFADGFIQALENHTLTDFIAQNLPNTDQELDISPIAKGSYGTGTLDSDFRRIRELFYNAVDAVKKEKNPEINMSIRQDFEQNPLGPQFFDFSIEDNGTGMSPDTLLNILFSPAQSSKRDGQNADDDMETDNQNIGCMGVGALAVLDMLRSEGAFVEVKTRQNDTLYTLRISNKKGSLMAHLDSTDLSYNPQESVKRPRPNSQTGTTITAHLPTTSPHCLRVLSRHLVTTCASVDIPDLQLSLAQNTSPPVSLDSTTFTKKEIPISAHTTLTVISHEALSSLAGIGMACRGFVPRFEHAKSQPKKQIVLLQFSDAFNPEVTESRQHFVLTQELATELCDFLHNIPSKWSEIELATGLNKGQFLDYMHDLWLSYSKHSANDDRLFQVRHALQDCFEKLTETETVIPQTFDLYIEGTPYRDTFIFYNKQPHPIHKTRQIRSIAVCLLDLKKSTSYFVNEGDTQFGQKDEIQRQTTLYLNQTYIQDNLPLWPMIYREIKNAYHTIFNGIHIATSFFENIQAINQDELLPWLTDHYILKESDADIISSSQSNPNTSETIPVYDTVVFSPETATLSFKEGETTYQISGYTPLPPLDGHSVQYKILDTDIVDSNLIIILPLDINSDSSDPEEIRQFIVFNKNNNCFTTYSPLDSSPEIYKLDNSTTPNPDTPTYAYMPAISGDAYSKYVYFCMNPPQIKPLSTYVGDITATLVDTVAIIYDEPNVYECRSQEIIRLLTEETDDFLKSTILRFGTPNMLGLLFPDKTFYLKIGENEIHLQQNYEGAELSKNLVSVIRKEPVPVADPKYNVYIIGFDENGHFFERTAFNGDGIIEVNHEYRKFEITTPSGSLKIDMEAQSYWGKEPISIQELDTVNKKTNYATLQREFPNAFLGHPASRHLNITPKLFDIIFRFCNGLNSIPKENLEYAIQITEKSTNTESWKALFINVIELLGDCKIDGIDFNTIIEGLSLKNENELRNLHKNLYLEISVNKDKYTLKGIRSYANIDGMRAPLYATLVSGYNKLVLLDGFLTSTNRWLLDLMLPQNTEMEISPKVISTHEVSFLKIKKTCKENKFSTDTLTATMDTTDSQSPAILIHQLTRSGVPKPNCIVVFHQLFGTQYDLAISTHPQDDQHVTATLRMPLTTLDISKLFKAITQEGIIYFNLLAMLNRGDALSFQYLDGDTHKQIELSLKYTDASKIIGINVTVHELEMPTADTPNYIQMKTMMNVSHIGPGTDLFSQLQYVLACRPAGHPQQITLNGKVHPATAQFICGNTDIEFLSGRQPLIVYQDTPIRPLSINDLTPFMPELAARNLINAGFCIKVIKETPLNNDQTDFEQNPFNSDDPLNPMKSLLLKAYCIYLIYCIRNHMPREVFLDDTTINTAAPMPDLAKLHLADYERYGVLRHDISHITFQGLTPSVGLRFKNISLLLKHIKGLADIPPPDLNTQAHIQKLIQDCLRHFPMLAVQLQKITQKIPSAEQVLDGETYTLTLNELSQLSIETFEKQLLTFWHRLMEKALEQLGHQDTAPTIYISYESKPNTQGVRGVFCPEKNSIHIYFKAFETTLKQLSHGINQNTPALLDITGTFLHELAHYLCHRYYTNQGNFINLHGEEFLQMFSCIIDSIKPEPFFELAEHTCTGTALSVEDYDYDRRREFFSHLKSSSQA